MPLRRYIALIVLMSGMLLCVDAAVAQSSADKTPPVTPAATEPITWDFNVALSGYYLPDGGSYASPTATVDHDKLHLEARYNYEGQRTGSLWAGYNFSVGDKLELDATPMIGGVFGRVNGIAPGLEATLTYKKRLQFYSANEYIFDTDTKAGNFFYTWTQLTYAPTSWFSGGYVLQRTRAYHSTLDIQRGITVEFTRSDVTFSTQIFNINEPNPSYVFALGYSFKLGKRK
jgi:hypothetical protein